MLARSGGSPRAGNVMPLYRRLLYVFPASFRRRFADDMASVFAERLSDAKRHGRRAVVVLWAMTVVDVAVQGTRERITNLRAGLLRGTAFDLRIAVRSIRRRPGFAAAVIATLSLGVGANVSVFSVVRAVLIEQAPFAEPDRVVRLWQTIPNARPQPFSVADFDAIGKGTSVFATLGACSGVAAILRGDASPEVVVESGVTEEFFRVFGVGATHGRTFGPADFDLSDPPVVLSSAVWRSQFSRAIDPVGQTVYIDRQPRTVVGVMPPSFVTPCSAGTSPEVWTPRRWAGAEPTSAPRQLTVVAALAPAASIEQAHVQVEGIMAPRRRASPDYEYDGVGIERVGEADAAASRPGLLLVQGVAVFLLLITCANLANLYLARMTSRQHEFGVRGALGATRWRLVRQMLTEASVLSLAGAVVGVGIAYSATPLLVSVASPVLPRGTVAAVGLPDLVVGLALACLTAVACVVGPAISADGRSPVNSLHITARATAGRSVRLLRHTLIATEVLLAVVVLTGAGLLIRSFANVVAVPMGFESENVVVADVPLYVTAAGAEDQRQLVSRIEQGLQHRLGSTPFAFANAMPYSRSFSSTSARVFAPGVNSEGGWRYTEWHSVTSNFFDVLGIPVIQGRSLDVADAARPEMPIVVSKRFADAFFPGQNPIGAFVETSRRRQHVVVGVVGDIRRHGPTSSPRPAMYAPLAEIDNMLAVAVRTSSAGPVSELLMQTLRDIDPELPLIGAGRAADKVKLVAAETRRRFYLVTIVLFAGLAGVLASVGIYGVTAHVVGLRTRELGIRLALGAKPGQIQNLLLRQGMVPVLIGAVGGSLAAWWLAKLLDANVAFQSQLYEVTSHDPVTFTAVVVLLVVVAAAACWIPGRRTASVNPARVLRAE